MELSVIEQSPRLRDIYTQLCFCYPYADHSENTTVTARLLSEDEITSTLRTGLHRLTASFPWIAGQVILDHDGKYKVLPFEQTPRLVVKDLTCESSMPTMDELRKANFPFRMLDEEVICPVRTLNGQAAVATKKDTDDEFRPVFLLQVNFITDGLLLCVLAVHSVMDIVGQGQMIRLLSRACRGEDFTVEEIRNGNMDRSNLIPLLDHVDSSVNNDAWKKPSTHVSSQGRMDSVSAPTDATPTFEWTYFTFDTASLMDLKAFAKSSSDKNASSTTTDFISTDDAICALIWRSIGSARLARLDGSTTSTFTRQVDVRRCLNIPESYPGNLVTQTTHTMTLDRLTQSTLSDLAVKFRSALDPNNLTHGIRSHATAQAQIHDSHLSQGSGGGSSKDRTRTIVMSSWSKVNCQGVDFGLGLGELEAVRRPRFAPTEGVVYLLPKAPRGDLVAGLCLRDVDMQALRQNKKFTKYATYVG